MGRISGLFRLALYLALAVCLGFSPAALARSTGEAGLTGWVELAELPPEARETLALIKRGGPFPFPHKDGSTFGNFEKHLPQRARGSYREYTVTTPGRRDRGARRIVAGSESRGDAVPRGEYYYTSDHYHSFRRIREP